MELTGGMTDPGETTEGMYSVTFSTLHPVEMSWIELNGGEGGATVENFFVINVMMSTYLSQKINCFNKLMAFVSY